jgi:hypothetical protein
MFAYCLNNPVIMADSNGNDAIYVVDTEWNRGLPVFGHAILYFQDEEGTWYMTDFAGQFPDPSTARIRLENASEEVISAMTNGESIDGIEYTYIQGDFSACLDYAEQNKDTDYGGYSLFKNNCLHYVKDLLRHGAYNKSIVQLYATFSSTIIPSNYQDALEKGTRRSELFEHRLSTNQIFRTKKDKR